MATTMTGRVVHVRPISKKSWLSGTEGGERYIREVINERGEHWYQTMPDPITKTRATGLTEEEEKAYEKKLHLEEGTLNRFNNDFWDKFIIKIPKKGRDLFIDTNPKDFLMYKALLGINRVANTYAESQLDPTYEFYLSEANEEAKVEARKMNEKLTAINHFSKMSSKERRDFLVVYAQSKHAYKRPADNASIDWIDTEVYKTLEANPSEFISIVTNPTFRTRVLIDDLVINKLLAKSGTKFFVYGGEQIASNTEECVQYLEDPHNSTVRAELIRKLQVLTNPGLAAGALMAKENDERTEALNILKAEADEELKQKKAAKRKEIEDKKQTNDNNGDNA